MIEKLSRKEALDIALEAVRLYAASHPVPTAVTLKQAAEMLGVCPKTARKFELPRNRAGLIPYAAVQEALATP
jgi:uncharacterized protein YbbK (DUF523 family)